MNNMHIPENHSERAPAFNQATVSCRRRRGSHSGVSGIAGTLPVRIVTRILLQEAITS